MPELLYRQPDTKQAADKIPEHTLPPQLLRLSLASCTHECSYDLCLSAQDIRVFSNVSASIVLAGKT